MNNMDYNSIELDAVKEYNYYYPDQNYELVAEKINKMNEPKMDKIGVKFLFVGGLLLGSGSEIAFGYI